MKRLVASILEEKWMIKSSGIILFTAAATQLTQFLLNLFLSKQFGPELFGIYKTIVYIFIFLPMLVDFGSAVTITKYISEFSTKKQKRIPYLFRWFFKLRIASYVLLLLAAFLLKDFIARYFLKSTSLGYLVLPGLLITTPSFFLIFDRVVLGYQNFKLYSLAQLSRVGILALALVALSFYGVYLTLVGWCFGTFGYLIYSRFLRKKRIFSKRYEKFNIRRVFLKFSLPMYLLLMPSSLPSFIVPILSVFFSQILIGYYAFAFMFLWAALLIPQTIYTVLFPKFSELNGLRKYSRAKEILLKIFSFYSFVALIGIAGVLLFSKWFLAFIAADYLPALPIFNGLIIFGFLSGYAVIYNAYLTGLGKVKEVALLTLIQSSLLLAVSYWLLSLLA